MSQESKVAVNLYGILDNELSRLHSLMQAHLSSSGHQVARHHASFNSFNQNSYDLDGVYARILKIQDIVIASVLNGDKELQERIAELALTGVNKNEP